MKFEVVHFYRFCLKINIQREVKMVDSQKKMGGLVSISKKKKKKQWKCQKTELGLMEDG